MNTIAITNGVTGNVGSCKVEKVTVNVAPLTLQDIATNSCTGEVMTYPEYADIGFGSFFAVIVIIAFVVFCFAVSAFFNS